ncbi:MAG: glycosyltransferase family 39 protein [Roseiflexus sp.]
MNSYIDTSFTSSDKPAKSLFSHSDFVWALTACLAALPCLIYIITAYINLDFWYDELYTLHHFVFVPISTIVTDYRAPNNHIFANILNHIYLYGINVDDYDLLRYPWKIRMLMLFYTFLTFIYVYRTAKDFFDPKAGFFAVLILGSTLPFINFAVQVRGYSLSMTLFSMLLYYNHRFYESRSKVSGFFVVILTSLLFYTIPSNIYIIAPIIVYWVSIYLISRIRDRNIQSKEIRPGREILLASMITLGMIITTIWYSQIIPQIIDNNMTRASNSPNLNTITNMMPSILGQLISKRWLLLIPVLYGITKILGKKQNQSNFYLFPTLMVLPFLMSAIRGDNPFDRTFIPLCVPFSIIGGIALSETIISLNTRFTSIFLAFTIITIGISFYLSVKSRDELLLSNTESGRNLQTITSNYYQNYYRPSELMREFVEKYQEGSIFLIHDETKWDEVAMPAYLSYWLEIYGKTLGEVYNGLEIRESWIRSKKPIYLVTNDASAHDLLKSSYPELDCRRITSPGQFVMVIECNHRDQIESNWTRAPLPDYTLPWVALGRGWYATEYAGSTTYRWGSADNTIWLVNPYDEPIQVTLALNLASYETTRPVELWHDRRLIARWNVERPMRIYRVRLSVLPGQSRFRLSAPTSYDPQSKRELSIVALRAQIADYTNTENK